MPEKPTLYSAVPGDLITGISGPTIFGWWNTSVNHIHIEALRLQDVIYITSYVDQHKHLTHVFLTLSGCVVTFCELIARSSP